MPVSMDELARDLESETAVLQQILDGLTDEQWTWPTPAPGWSVTDQVSHLAHSDEVAVLSATDRAGFEALLVRENESVERRTERWAQQHRHLSPAEIMERREKVYVLLNKPKGYLSSVSDPEGRPTVLELLPASLGRVLSGWPPRLQHRRFTVVDE